jgi:competence protein ComEC
VDRKYEFDETVLEIIDAPRLENSKQSENEVLEGLTKTKNGNQGSTVVAVKYRGHSLLFTGDIDASQEKRIKNLEQYDVLKVAHHGSKHSSSLKFLEQVNPKIAVISVGAANRYGHPHIETLERLAKVGSKVLRTDELGAIKIEFNKNGIGYFGYMDNDFRRIAF